MRLKDLSTEGRNRATEDLDTMSTLEMVTVMNREDTKIPRAIQRALPQIAKAVDVIAHAFANGGRLIYVGTGTSGRIGALDASECPPTFGTSPEMVQFLIAGGENALVRATEASEDSIGLGRSDMAAMKPGKRDVVAAIAASGRTPYTMGALEVAKKKGATTIAITCNRNSELAKMAKIRIEAEVGPEVLTGSTRLKAGTAQKQICNMLTTGAMVKLGYVYSNLMVNMHLINEKLVERGILILESLAFVSRDVARETLEKAEMSLPLALVMLKANVGKSEAIKRLRKAKGNVRKAIEG
jgi:N-acetylmuramic acid 6-phosphate etherase